MPQTASRRTDEQPLLTIADVCRRVGLSRQTVSRAIQQGELRSFLFGNRRRFRASDVDKWVLSHIDLQD